MWVEYVERIEAEMKSVTVSFGTCHRKRSVWRSGRKWKDSTEMYSCVREIYCAGEWDLCFSRRRTWRWQDTLRRLMMEALRTSKKSVHLNETTRRYLIDSAWGQIANFCELGNEQSGSNKPVKVVTHHILQKKTCKNFVVVTTQELGSSVILLVRLQRCA